MNTKMSREAGSGFAGKKFLVLIFAVFLIAAACNRGSNDQTNNAITPPQVTSGDQDNESSADNEDDNGEEPNNPAPTPTPPVAANSATITYTSSGYSPNSVTITKGGTVTFINNSSSPFWPASAPHPSHTDYPEFDPQSAVSAGGSWSFTFDKAGTWRFHDHLFPTRFGSVTVVE